MAWCLLLQACAPRYVWFSQSVNNTRRDPVGTCYVARNAFSDVAEYSPCRTREYSRALSPCARRLADCHRPALLGHATST
ncbi:hypothetical protein PR048_000297 [Dryococelus australis]|uniref:Secreted protein n=1 Tax=Dryococelus australis TaxID=614101 RepID=A0ABQ9IEB0_9NEOP|nr:hypothetical protein PR048_000297 [Dryococelus australis]